MKISHGLEYAGLLILTKAAQIMPGRLADLIGIGIGKIAYYLLKSRRQIAKDNIRRAFPGDLSETRITEIVKRVFVNIARVTIEFVRQPVVSREEFLRSVVSVRGAEYIDKIMIEGKGGIAITAHYGNWEHLGRWFASAGYPSSILIGWQHNEKVNDLFTSFRKTDGLRLIKPGVSARQILKSLKKNKLIGIAADQHAAAGGIVLDFLGRPALTHSGPAAFAVKAGSPIVCGYMVREGYSQFRIEITPPIYPPNTGNTENDIIQMTKQYTSILETWIRENPEEWMWTHRRWKID